MPHAETHAFDTETGKIFQLMIHSLYENKEIFVRELVSNASDACDKLRYLALSDSSLMGEDEAFKITVSVDEAARTLTIADNGVGMNKQGLMDNLGTIARSGTERFFDEVEKQDGAESQLIGQFGVGFYSAFMVADKVVVTSQAAGEEVAYEWSSTGDASYELQQLDEPRGHGTTVTLHLREGEDEYADTHRLEHILSTYSSHIAFDLELLKNDGEVVQITSGQAIWQRSPSEVSENEYHEFYKTISYLGGEAPWLTLHNRVEGVVEYKNLLFIPSTKPFDLHHPDRETSVKLYIKRVFIAEQLELIPRYLRFIRGVVDSEDLPLNISRETVQNSQVVQKIRASITKKILAEIAKKAEKEPEEYQKFWANFGAVLKEGLCEGVSEPREDILKACRFYSSTSDAQTVSLADYKARMKDGQEKIYYITGEDYDAVLNSPQLEGFKKREIEVLILTDSVDDFWVNVVSEFDGASFQSVTRGEHDLDTIQKLDEADSEDEKAENDNQPDAEAVVKFFAETLGERVQDVRTTTKLAESPVCITVPEGAMDIRLERFMVENKQLQSSSAKVLEINPKHAIIQHISAEIEQGSDGEALQDLVHLLFAQANVAEGEPVTDVSGFTRRLNRLIEGSLKAA